MKISVVGAGPISLKIRTVLIEAGHEIVNEQEEDPLVPDYDVVDCIVWCRGNNTEWCITNLSAAMEAAPSVPFVVVTSEHGSIPTANPKYHTYAAVKAGQKMLVQAFVKSGGKAVDVSPAFVATENPTRRMNRDSAYRTAIRTASNDEFPVTVGDVAAAVLFAAENCGKISGTVIKVSAGWQDGGIF